MSEADVVLVHPTYSYPDKGPPLGLAYLQAFLKAGGVKCSLLDVDAHGLSHRDAIRWIESKRPRILGMSFMTNQAVDAQQLAVDCKQAMPGLVVVAGGCHASALPVETLAHGFDAVVVGEGERTFLHLVTAILSGDGFPDNLPGLLLPGQAEDQFQRADLIEDLDIVPFPDWSDLPGGKYGSTILGSRINAPAFSVLTSRGCPNDCIFCASKSVFNRRFRKRSAKNIFLELLELRGRFNARLIKFVDDTLTVDKDRVFELCERISGLGLEWMCNARVNTISKELLVAMAGAGCKNICFGVESADPAVLSRIKKKITVEQIKEAHSLAKQAGLSVSSYFMVGNLGETFESIKKTVTLAAEITDYPSVSIATPYPGTELFDICEERGWILTRHWDKYVTTPHVMANYSPVAANGTLNKDQILEAYYYVNRKFMRQKLRSKYGRRFYLNSKFYAHEFGARGRSGGFAQAARIGAKLLSARSPSAR